MFCVALRPRDPIDPQHVAMCLNVRSGRRHVDCQREHAFECILFDCGAINWSSGPTGIHLHQLNPHAELDDSLMFITEPITNEYDSSYGSVASRGLGGTVGFAILWSIVDVGKVTGRTQVALLQFFVAWLSTCAKPNVCRNAKYDAEKEDTEPMMAEINRLASVIWFARAHMPSVKNMVRCSWVHRCPTWTQLTCGRLWAGLLTRTETKGPGQKMFSTLFLCSSCCWTSNWRVYAGCTRGAPFRTLSSRSLGVRHGLGIKWAAADLVGLSIQSLLPSQSVGRLQVDRGLHQQKHRGACYRTACGETQCN